MLYLLIERIMIQYNVISRLSRPGDNESPRKYYAISQTSGEVTLQEMAEDLAELSTVNTPDVYAVLESLFRTIPRYIKRGEIVRLGSLGSLTPSISSKGSDTAEEVNASNITSVKVRFNPGRDFTHAIQNASFKRIAQQEDEEATGGEGGGASTTGS